MGTLDRRAAGLAAQSAAQVAMTIGSARPERRPQRSMPLMRKYEVAGLSSSGRLVSKSCIAPAEPHLDEAVAAFAHGTLIATPNGPVAVEDLEPGMQLRTADAGPRTLVWVGSTVLTGPAAGPGAAVSMTRITADSLGFGRPMPDLVLGPRARMMVRHPGCRRICGSDEAFAPASAFVDGASLIALHPVRPTRVYHLALARQHILLANGIEVESYHPGENAVSLLEPTARRQFLGLFPYLEGRAEFGPMVLPRLTAFEFESLRAA